MIRKQVYPDEATAAAATAHFLEDLLRERIASNSRATFAISGGKSPRAIFGALAKAALDWNAVHIFWVDERAVPPDDPQSNYRMAKESLLEPAGIPAANIHRVKAELEPAQAAQEYVRDIQTFFGLKDGELPCFDLVHRGMGPDAHTASLFPGEPLITDRQNVAAAVYVEKMKQWRITLLTGPLMAARYTAMFVTGEDKAEAARAVFQEPYDLNKYPAQMSAHPGQSVTWFFDQAAACLLKE